MIDENKTHPMAKKKKKGFLSKWGANGPTVTATIYKGLDKKYKIIIKAPASVRQITETFPGRT